MEFPRLVVLAADQVDFASHVSRPIVGPRGTKDGPFVAVATGHDGKSFVLAPRTDKRSDEALVARATATTQAQTWSWSVAETSGFLFWKSPSLLRGMGDPLVPVPQMATDGGGIDDLATELLLIPAAMEEASRLLGAAEIYAVVPKRGWLLVARGQGGMPLAPQTLHQAARGIAERAGRSIITGNVALVIKQGHLAGADRREGNKGSLSLQGADESAWWP